MVDQANSWCEVKCTLPGLPDVSTFLPFQTLSDSLVNRGDNSSEDENTAEISDPSLIEISSGPAANGDLSDDVSLNDNEDMDLSATASDNDERTGPLSPPSPPLFSTIRYDD